MGSACMINTLKALCVVTAIGLFVSLSLYSLGRIGYFDAKHTAKRLNCEDLGRCNLKTGEVYDTVMTNAQAAMIVYLYGNEGESL